MPSEERWPPSYDFADLEETIRSLTDSTSKFLASFYSETPSIEEVPFCQGDILQFSSGIPYIDKDGSAAVLEGDPTTCWLLLSNTCDMDRSLDDVPYCLLMPIFDWGNVPDQIRTSLIRYELAKRFFLPAWDDEHGSSTYVIEFGMVVTAARQALSSHAQVQARLSQHSWYLLNCGLVRFFARDDGRTD